MTAVELLPVHQFFSEPAAGRAGPGQLLGLQLARLLRPAQRLRASGDRGQQVTEFKRMVKAFHEAGLEVILDVVYNHTAEAGPRVRRCPSAGSTTAATTSAWCRRRRPAGSTGASPGHLLGRHRLRQHRRHRPPAPSLRMILDSLRYWVTEMHVDGFRFDLMRALTRTGTTSTWAPTCSPRSARTRSCAT